MMQPKLMKWLRDLVAACDLILERTAGRSLADYEADRFLQSGIERNFEITGEILMRLLRSSPDTASRITDIRDIIGFRNILAHGYDVVDHARVWQIIQDNLPILRAEAFTLLTELDHEEASPDLPDEHE